MPKMNTISGGRVGALPDDAQPPPGQSTGLIPRDYSRYPVGSLPRAQPFDLPIIPRAEWPSRLEALKAVRGTLRQIRDTGNEGQRIPSRDQNGRGYCWAHSTVSAMLLVRAIMGLPYADLSPYSIACKIKGFRDEGGFGAESLEFAAANGCATAADWPQKSVDRRYDNPTTWRNAKQYRITEWMDLEPRNLDQFMTCLLSGIPVVCDYNWWGHSVCALEPTSFDPIAGLIWNSWGDGWSDNGVGELKGDRWLPDAMIAPRVIVPM